jgi:hypothetical protein
MGKEKDGAPGEIRTPDLMLRRHSLYPAELRAHTLIRIPYFADSEDLGILQAPAAELARPASRWTRKSSMTD